MLEIAQPIADLVGVLGLYAALRRDQKRTRAMVFAIAKHLGLRVEDGIHIENRTPARGNPTQPTMNGEAMKRTLSLLFLGALLGALLGAASCSYTAADARTDAPRVLDQVASGAVSGAATGGPSGAVIGAVSGLLSAVLGIAAGKMHSAPQIAAANAAAAAVQAAHDNLLDHQSTLVDQNGKLAAQLDMAHQLVHLALMPDAAAPASQPAPVAKVGA